MANLKITELPEQTANPAADDLFVTIDVSDPAPTNQTKKIRSDKLFVHTASQLAANVVETAKIKDAAVTIAKLATGAVTNSKIGDGAVTALKLGNGAVTTLKLEDGAVTTAKLATGAVNAAKIAPSTAGYHLITNAAGAVAWVEPPVPQRFTSTLWDGDVKTVGTYTVNLNTVFGVPTAARVVFVSASAKWAAASNSNYISISPYSGLGWRGIVLRSIVANMEIDGYGPIIVPSNGNLYVEVGGANTLLTILQVEGYLL